VIASLFSARPQCSRLELLALTALWIAVLPNLGALSQFSNAWAAGSGWKWLSFVVACWLAMYTAIYLNLIAIGCFFWRQSVRWLCAIALVSAAALGYFTFALGMRFERTMFANLIGTNLGEVRELITPTLVVWMLAVGVVPAMFALRTLVQRKVTLKRSLSHTALSLSLLCAVVSALVLPQYQRFASAARNKSITFETVAPINFVGAAIGHWHAMRKLSLVRTPIDSTPQTIHPLARPRLVVFVLGETARAQNHALNGYARETNPRLKSMNIAYFPNSESCGTATTISVPCIFSGMGRSEFSMLKGMERQTLVDLVKKTGINVLWRENDGGCKDVCVRSRGVRRLYRCCTSYPLQ
jgi:lipid A ethanolaminephosphotransferase